MRRRPAEHFRKASEGLVSLGSMHSGLPAVTGVETERKRKGQTLFEAHGNI